MTEEADEASDFFLRSLALPAPVSASVGGAGTAIRTVLVCPGHSVSRLRST